MSEAQTLSFTKAQTATRLHIYRSCLSSASSCLVVGCGASSTQSALPTWCFRSIPIRKRGRGSGAQRFSACSSSIAGRAQSVVLSMAQLVQHRGSSF